MLTCLCIPAWQPSTNLFIHVSDSNGGSEGLPPVLLSGSAWVNHAHRCMHVFMQRVPARVDDTLHSVSVCPGHALAQALPAGSADCLPAPASSLASPQPMMATEAATWQVVPLQRREADRQPCGRAVADQHPVHANTYMTMHVMLMQAVVTLGHCVAFVS